MTTRMVSKNRAIVFLTAQLFFAFALALAFHSSAWAGEDHFTLRAKAEAGDPKAQDSLGLSYVLGLDDLDGPPDDAKVAHWYHLAAKQGDVNAQLTLGFLYEKGLGVPQDYGKAAHWYRLAAQQGFAHAQGWLGWLYANGQGVPQDYAKAASWLRLAAAPPVARSLLSTV